MSDLFKPETNLDQILKQTVTLNHLLKGVATEVNSPENSASTRDRFVEISGQLISELQRVREQLSSVRFGSIGITLGRSDGIAKFFAFSFVNQSKRNLDELVTTPFYGSGVYAIYYHGNSYKAYQPLSGTETPIYVGKADPANAHAETAEAQGTALYNRLKEHAGSITKAKINLNEFRYRSAAIQSGMQSAVEDYLIRLFQPIWNKEVKVCFGIGKHGDKASTRTNKRSPWDTMHPGRKWAADTTMDQAERSEIELRIEKHFKNHSVISDKVKLFEILSLE
jgi:hypothetical protein